MAEARVVQGYIDPNFPNPMTESSATIIIYGCVSTAPEMEIKMLMLLLDIRLLSLSEY